MLGRHLFQTANDPTDVPLSFPKTSSGLAKLDFRDGEIQIGEG